MGACAAARNGQRGQEARGQAETYALAIGLTVLAGFIDATGYIHFHHLFVSFMSGNSTQAVVAVAGRDPAALAAVGRTILLFVVGVTLGELLAALSPRWGRPLVLLVELALLAVALTASATGSPEAVAASTLALAMGVQNAAVHQAEGISVALTYVTGTLVHVGRGVAAALRRKAPWRAVLPFLGLWLGLASGGLVGALVAARSLEVALAGACGASLLLLAAVFARAALRPPAPPFDRVDTGDGSPKLFR